MVMTRILCPSEQVQEAHHGHRSCSTYRSLLTRWYHCITRCVRRAFLLGEGISDRRQWLENRIEELAQIFAIGVGGFSMLDNHLHLLLRIDPDVADAWSDEEVVQRWGRLFPPRDSLRRILPVSADWIKQRLDDPHWVATMRERLQNIGWFMKCLKEPLARLANREDEATRAFLKGRSFCLRSRYLTI